MLVAKTTATVFFEAAWVIVWMFRNELGKTLICWAAHSLQNSKSLKWPRRDSNVTFLAPIKVTFEGLKNDSQVTIWVKPKRPLLSHSWALWESLCPRWENHLLVITRPRRCGSTVFHKAQDESQTFVTYKSNPMSRSQAWCGWPLRSHRCRRPPRMSQGPALGNALLPRFLCGIPRKIILYRRSWHFEIRPDLRRAISGYLFGWEGWR